MQFYEHKLLWTSSLNCIVSITDPSNPGDVDVQISDWEATTITSALKFYLRYRELGKNIV